MLAKIEGGHVGSLTDVELLEVLLFYVIPRSNTNVNAHALLDRLGSLKGVFDADAALLESVDGIGARSAAFFTVVGEANRRISASEGKADKRFFSIEQVGEFFIKRFAGAKKECVMLLALDNKNAIIDCRTVYDGTVNSSVVSVRNIIKTALELNASRIVVAHNHPSGDASPSDDDIVFTRTLRRTCGEIELDLVEHILVAQDRYMPLVAYMTRASGHDYRN